MDSKQLNYWICWDDSSTDEPCFLCEGDPEVALNEMREFDPNSYGIEGEPSQLPIPKREYDCLHSAKLFDYRNLGDGFVLAHVIYKDDKVNFEDPAFDPMCGVITRDGAIVIPFSYTSIFYDKESRHFRCYSSKTWCRSTVWEGRVDHVSHQRTSNGEMIIEHDDSITYVSKYYDLFRQFSEGLCAVRMCSPNYPNGYGWGFVSTDGETVIGCKSDYLDVSDFQEGYAIVKKVDHQLSFIYGYQKVKYNYISTKGIELLGADVLEAKPFVNGQASIKVVPDGHYQKINKLGQIIQ